MVEVVACNRCKKSYKESEQRNSSHFAIQLRRYTDAAGDTDTECLIFDLCPSCQATILRKILDKYDWSPDAPGFVKSLGIEAEVKG